MDFFLWLWTFGSFRWTSTASWSVPWNVAECFWFVHIKSSPDILNEEDVFETGEPVVPTGPGNPDAPVAPRPPFVPVKPDAPVIPLRPADPTTQNKAMQLPQSTLVFSVILRAHRNNKHKRVKMHCTRVISTAKELRPLIGPWPDKCV